MERKKDIIIIIALIIICGIVSIIIGMGRSADVLNYHIYSPWALLNNRYNIDFMPAGIQSYFNPLLNIPYFLMVMKFNSHPALMTFICGFPYALFLFIIYKIANLFFENEKWHKLLSILIGGTSAPVIFNIGIDTYDIESALFILFAFYLLLCSLKNFSLKKILLACFLVGFGTGLKLTSGIFALSIAVSMLCFYKHFKLTPKRIFYSILSAFSGFMITDGFWLLKMYKIFHNPFFPYFNEFFHSDIINSNSILLKDYEHIRPKNIYEILIYPFLFCSDKNEAGWELPFKDYRFLGVYIVVIIYSFNRIREVIINIINKNKEKKELEFNDIAFIFLLVNCIFAYIIFAKCFGNIRYLCPIAGISGIILIYGIKKLINFISNLTKNNKLNKTIIPLAILISLFILFQTKTPLGGRIPVNNKYHKMIYVEDMKIPDNSVVFSGLITSAIIPFQNPNVRYLINENMINFNILTPNKINEIDEIMINNSDRLYYIAYLPIQEGDDIEKITSENFECKKINSNLLNNYISYFLCKIKY